MLTPEREKEIRSAILNEVWGTNSFGLDIIKELLAEIDELREEKAKVVLALGEFIEGKLTVSAKQLGEKLDIAVEALEKMADWENPNPLKYICWPTSTFMANAREALNEIKGVIK